MAGEISEMSVRAALLFVLQPVLSGLFALALTAAFAKMFRPRRPAVRALIWLLPLLKIALDLAAACPAMWVVAQGVIPEQMKQGERMGTLAVGLSGPYIPLFLFATVRLEYDLGGHAPRGSTWGGPTGRGAALEQHTPGGLLHPGDLLYSKLGRAGTLWLIALLIGVGIAKMLLRTVRLFAFRLWLEEKLPGAKPLEGHGVEELITRAGWPRPNVLVVPGLTVPFATGFLEPRVMVPEALLATLTDAELAALLAHEMAHLRRADPLVRVLVGYLLDLFWYVPGLSGCVRRFQAEREAECDDAARADEPSRLARALLKTHEWVQGLSPSIPGLAPSWAPAAVEASTLKMRLTRLVEPAPTASRGVRFAATLGWLYVASVVLRSSLAGLN